MQLRLPTKKLETLRQLISEFSWKDKCSRKDLERLAGKLAHASMVVKGGRTFSRRVINFLKYLPEGTELVILPD